MLFVESRADLEIGAPTALGAQFAAILVPWAAALVLAAAPSASGLRFGIMIVAISLPLLFNLAWIHASMASRMLVRR